MKVIRILGVVVLVLMLAGLVLGTACAGAKGEEGPTGVGIESVVNNGDGTFTLEMTDGSSFTTPNQTGPQGAKGDKGDIGDRGPQGPYAWGTSFLAGVASSLCFDGTNIWAVDYVYDKVTKLRASDGANLGTFAVGDLPSAICFDGSNIWVTNLNDDNVTKLRASDGSNQGTLPVGQQPNGICFDGTDVWVCGGSVVELRASDGACLRVIPALISDLCFDGVNIWMADADHGVVTKLPA